MDAYNDQNLYPTKMSELSQSTTRNSASFRDPAGFVYQQDGVLLRQINKKYRESYLLLKDSGLYDALLQKSLIVAHEEVETDHFLTAEGYKVIAPEPVSYISYPYEWCFSQLKDAALLTLAIQKTSLKHGMTLKDASAYNVMFSGPSPIFIDTLSFEKFEGKPWVAYKQFCQHFLAPLALMSKTDQRLSKLMSVYIDGIPLDLCSRLLPLSTRFNLGLLTHIHMHAKSQKKYADEGKNRDTAEKIKAINFTENKAIALIDHLTSTVQGLTWKMSDTEWGNYYTDTNYKDASLQEKASVINDFCAAIPDEYALIQDLGANDGKFGREVSKHANQVVCHDIDEVAVEKNYLAAKSAGDRKILPLVLDISNPSAAIGWGNAERQAFVNRSSVDVTMALALIHHIAISNNVPLDKIAALFSKLSKFLIIEFVEKSDSQVARLLATREDIFEKYTIEGFEEEFSRYFKILRKHPITDTHRTMYLLEVKTWGDSV